MKVIALYFPQFHRIKENDDWWGEGFTDWNNVRSAKPLFDGHHQPRMPHDGNYYDQSELTTLRWQAALARKYGIYGFCHYHYWFDGKQLLEAPTNLMLENHDIDMPFCLSWANETWSRRWDGLDHHILIQQTHPPQVESWRQHFEYLIKAWKDPRAIKIDGKPVFVIYRPQTILHIDEMIAMWKKWSIEEGLPGIYIIHQKQYDFSGSEKYTASFDGIFQFQPFEAIFSIPEGHCKSIERARNRLSSILHNLLALTGRKSHKIYDYESTWKKIVSVKSDPSLKIYPGAFIDWDNTARYKNRATIFKGATPERFQYWMSRLADSMPARNLPEDFVFLNAWNEWSEGTYLEPDKTHGYRYLEAVQAALRAHAKSA